ncbi:MAG: resolvase [Arthrobacter sp.]|nr:resolvase [Arthrobacter sp.]
MKLNIGGSIHNPTDPVGRLLFNVLAMVAEFESDLIRARTREGMQVAKAKGRLRGTQPKLSKSQEARLISLYKEGQHTTAEIAELFKVGRSTIYRIVIELRSLVRAERVLINSAQLLHSPEQAPIALRQRTLKH